MQRDFFDDDTKQTAQPNSETQSPRPESAAPHAKPSINPQEAHIIEAEVVEEVEAQRPHQGGGGGGSMNASSSHEKLILMAFVLVLLGSIFMLNTQTKAKPDTNFAVAPSMELPVVVRYAPVEKTYLSQDEQIEVSFDQIKQNAAKLQQSVKALARPEVPSNKVLSEADYRAFKAYLAQKEGITAEADVRDILLQAGYTLPARLPEEEVANKRTNKDHVNFARDVISRLLKDEVEDFLEKVQIASEVGVYVADTAQE